MRSRPDGIIIAILTLLLGSVPLRAQTRVLRIPPSATDPAIATVHGPNVAVYDPQAPHRHRLLLFLPGTGVRAASSLPLDRAFARWGYHAISLDYENNVIAVTCAHSKDKDCFGRYRRAIVTGAAVSKKIKVDPTNSILNRFQKLLVYLAKHDSNGGWSQFLNQGEPRWSHIIVAGHSQGAGHAPYIAKLYRVDRVLIFSGPQDYLDNLHQPAPWLAQTSATPPSRFFAFLNLKDPFNVHHQIANCKVLMEGIHPRPIMVKPGETIQGYHHILINNIPTKQHHSSTLFPVFKNVWKYMVTTKVR
jgi:hypothetical protein